VTLNRRPTKRARGRVRQSLSPLLARSPSPYCIGQSSPYVFNKDFYNNSKILNRDLTLGGATYGTANNRHKKHLRDAYKNIINSTVINNKFKPLLILDLARPIEAHLPNSYVINNPTTFFKLFLGDKQYDLIVRNTNKYTEAYLTLYPRNSTQPFKPTC
jgi:hypothetical protein